MTRTIALAGLVVLLLSAFASAAGAAALYANDENNYPNTTFHQIEETTGASTPIGPTVLPLSVSGLAYDSSTGTMYASDVYDSSSASYGLGSVNLSTGEITYIGSHVNSSNIWGLAYDSKNDVLYGADFDCASYAGGLATINRATGESTCTVPFSNLKTIQMSGLAYDPSNDTL